MKLVSIIIPVYNAEQHIEKCVESILSQTYENIEVLFVNDGSVDNSALICDGLSEQHDNFSAFHGPNLGPSGARNVGIKNCTGDLIYFLDIDDSIKSNAIEILVDEYEKNDVDLVIGDFIRVTDGVKSPSGNKLSFSKDTLLTKTEILSYAREYFKIPYKFLLFNHIWNKLFRADLIRNNNLLFNPELRNLEDVDFNYKYLNYTNRVFYKNIPTYNYTIRSDSQSFVIGDDLNDVTKYPSTFKTIKSFLHSNSLMSEEEIQREVGHLYISCTIIILIRLCGNLNLRNSYKIYRNAAAIVSAAEVQENLKFYLPTKNDIRYVHILMKFRFIILIIMVCCKRYRAHRNFKR